MNLPITNCIIAKAAFDLLHKADREVSGRSLQDFQGNTLLLFSSYKIQF